MALLLILISARISADSSNFFSQETEELRMAVSRFYVILCYRKRSCILERGIIVYEAKNILFSDSHEPVADRV